MSSIKQNTCVCKGPSIRLEFHLNIIFRYTDFRRVNKVDKCRQRLSIDLLQQNAFCSRLGELACEHRTKIVTTSSEHNSMSRELDIICHKQNITQLALPEQKQL